MAPVAMFEGLVVDEAGNALTVTTVGENACYVLWDDDFKRHIDAELVDGQVLRAMRDQVQDQRDVAVQAVLEMMGRDDIFTKAAVESSINNMDKAVGNPIPDEARQWLGMLGFRVVVDVQGTVVDIAMPAGGAGEE
jgi:hypothetical protein